MKIGQGALDTLSHNVANAGTPGYHRRSISVIDIQEMAQRNLQSALAKQAGQMGRAEAALMLADGQQALLTISVNEELFYTRRLDLPKGFMDMAWGGEQEVAVAAEGFTPVDEYVPDYDVGGAPYGTDYSGA